MAFFRGIESKYTTRQVGMREIPEAVIGLAGLAPVHHVLPENRTVNQLKIISSDTLGAALCGPDAAELAAYSLPMAVTVNSLETGPLMLMVNVFDPARHNKPMTPETVTFPLTDKVRLAAADIIAATVKKPDGSVTYADGTDYTIDRITGLLRRLPGGSIPVAGTVAVTGTLADPAAVTPAEIVGAISDSGGRTGLKLLETAFQTFGIQPTDFLAPGFEALPSVRMELARLAGRLGGHAHVAYPVGTTVEQALSSRGPLGPHEFQISDRRVKLHYPMIESPRADNSLRLVPLSMVYAAVWGRTIMDDGFWYSGSNRPMQCATGLERPITHGTETDDANLLNAAGISTVRSSWGSSLHTWGPSTSAFPELTDPTHFDSVQRFYDVVDRRIALTLLYYIDRPLTPALARQIVGEIDDFYRLLIKKGALIDGSCTFSLDDNPAEQLAQGWFVTRDDLTPPPPFQRLTRKTTYNKDALTRAFAAI
jgi:phage tail sheath protein FI